MEMCFSMWFAPKCYKQGKLNSGEELLYGGEFEYLQSSPASHRKQRKCNLVPGCIRAALFLGYINTATWPPGWWSLESGIVKYGHEFPQNYDPGRTEVARARSNFK
jgi:hypothetical protein